MLKGHRQDDAQFHIEDSAVRYLDGDLGREGVRRTFDERLEARSRGAAGVYQSLFGRNRHSGNPGRRSWPRSSAMPQTSKTIRKSGSSEVRVRRVRPTAGPIRHWSFGAISFASILLLISGLDGDGFSTSSRSVPSRRHDPICGPRLQRLRRLPKERYGGTGPRGGSAAGRREAPARLRKCAPGLPVRRFGGPPRAERILGSWGRTRDTLPRDTLIGRIL